MMSEGSCLRAFFLLYRKANDDLLGYSTLLARLCQADAEKRDRARMDLSRRDMPSARAVHAAVCLRRKGMRKFGKDAKRLLTNC